MKVLIVDDQYEKVKFYAKALNKNGITNIIHVTNSHEALKHMASQLFDLLILDLKIPERLGEEVNPRGGVELLEHVEMHEKLFTPNYVIGATSHRDSFLEFKEYFDKKGWKLILGIDDEDVINSIIESRVKYSESLNKKFDIAILTALARTELEALLNITLGWCRYEVHDDCNIYYVCNIKNIRGESVSVIATSCLRMGIASSSAIAMKMLIKFEPKYLLMVGIAAGIKGKTNIGDILVADPCWDWGSGKLTIKNGCPEFLSAPHQIGLNPRMRAIIKEISIQRTYLDQIYESWDKSVGNRPDHNLNIHIGPVATGAVVLEDPSTLQSIIKQHREIIGIEMEAYGLMAAAEYATSSKRTESIVIKSVCDFADVDKNDCWQKYAAYSSSNFAYCLIRDFL